MKPTAEFLRHDAVEPPLIDARHFRAHWRVRTPLDRLLADRAITAREYRAGVEFRDLAGRAQRAGLGVPLWLRRGGHPVPDGNIDQLERQLDATTKLHQIALHLGAVMYALLDAAVVQNLSWAAIGRGFGIDPKTARAWSITAIRALAQI